MAVIGPVNKGKIGGESKRYIMVSGDSLGPEQIGGFRSVSVFALNGGASMAELHTSHDGSTWYLFDNIDQPGVAAGRNRHRQVGPIHYLKFVCPAAGAACIVVCGQ